MKYYLAVDLDGHEWKFSKKPNRQIAFWIRPDCEQTSLAKGTIRKLTGKKLTWHDEPYEIYE